MLWFIGISLNQSQSVLGGAKLQTELNRLRKELVFVERVRSKVVLVVQQKTPIGQMV